MKVYLILFFGSIIFNSIILGQDPEVLLSEANSKMKIGELNLADSLLIPKRGTITFPESYDVTIDLNSEVVDNLIKAKNALSGISDMMITTIEDEDRGRIIEFSFGDVGNYSNKIRYSIDEGITIGQDIKLPFNSDLFKEILNSNKDLESGKISISEEGFMKLEFSTEDISSVYYMVRKEDSTYV